MNEFNIVTPSILFSAISLIMLAYTNRFVAYSQVIRNISEEYLKTQSPVIESQIHNFRKRLKLMRTMQIFGVICMLLCVVSMFFAFIGLKVFAVWSFFVAIIAMIISLCISVSEIIISAKALDIHLCSIDEKGKFC